MHLRLFSKDGQDDDPEEPQVRGANGANLPALGIAARNGITKEPTEATEAQDLPEQPDSDALPLPVQNQNTAKGSVTVRRPNNRFGVHWARFVRRLGTGTTPSTSSLRKDGTATDSGLPGKSQVALAEATDEVDEVVVDRIWSEEIKTSVTHSVYDNTNEKSGSLPNYQATDDIHSISPNGIWSRWPVLAFFRWRMWPMIGEIFSSKFDNEDSEKQYAQENWFIKKSLAMWSALWLILNWVLGCIFAQPIYQIFDIVYYYVWAPLVSIPIVIMVIYDWPRDRPTAYQIFLVISVWSWAFYNVIFIYSCPYYPNSPHHYFNCQQRDFVGLLYYATALQTVGLFGLKLDRLPAAIGAGCFFVITSALLIPLKKSWARSMLNQLFFHTFLIYVHYMRESSERRLFTLRDQLKVQYKATQKAQVNERKAADSKRRLTSYVFHEVRVPLNTALLAVQNMGASRAVAKDHEVEFTALEGSLSMMSKVLNDVLDFNRMDSGKFESAAQPYGFHQVIQSLFIPLRLVTDARGLKFVTKLDRRIDQVARRAAYEAMGETPEAISRHLENYPDVDGIVVGDESRLRQIITNLASNACKFTPEGGKLSITTQLLHPALPTVDGDGSHSSLLVSGKEADDQDSAKDKSDSSRPSLPERRSSLLKGRRPLSTKYLNHHNEAQPRPPLERIVVRIEISDTGYGIRPEDMTQNKLFSAFNQTEQGRQQGGKGTGLGLALVRQIVKLSGGRLGLKSKIGHGSTFWVELPLTVGKQALQNESLPEQTPTATTSKEVSPVSDDGLKTLMTMDGPKSKLAAPKKGETRPNASPKSTNNAAVHGLMDQAGRVELVLQRYESDSAAPLSRSIVDSLGSSHVLSKVESARAESSRSPSPETSRKADRPRLIALPERTLLSADSEGTSNGSPGSDSMTINSAGEASPTISRIGPKKANSSKQSLNIEPNLPVLVVDDDPLTRTLMKRLLTRLGCQVSTAENGEVALEMILGPQEVLSSLGTPSIEQSGTGPILERRTRSGSIKYNPEDKYAVVFLDNQMPVLSGLDAVARLRELGRKDFVVGVTGNALLSDQREYLQAGVDKVLTKPVLERSLKEILLTADEQRKSKPGF